jgi:hypothetical protein
MQIQATYNILTYNSCSLRRFIVPIFVQVWKKNIPTQYFCRVIWQYVLNTYIIYLFLRMYFKKILMQVCVHIIHICIFKLSICCVHCVCVYVDCTVCISKKSGNSNININRGIVLDIISGLLYNHQNEQWVAI